MEAALLKYRAMGVRKVAFGDIFLEDLRIYRERNLAKLGMEGIFPIWKRETKTLVREFIQLGFKAILCCVDPKVLDPSFVGRTIDDEFLRALPESVDPCGENGEFHSFVYGGPILKEEIRIAAGEKVLKEGFWFCDLFAVEESANRV